MSQKGICYLVGAGPGDPDLLTLKARACLKRADSVFYDNLVSSAILSMVPVDAEMVYVGKSAGRHGMTQEQICTRICEQALAGKTVVRLKGGDPFVFGRGGEEALALVRAGIRFEVVPGVTAGIGAAAYAGIPVTHRGLATAITFVTGHEAADRGQPRTDWEMLAKGAQTLCVYMGIGRMREICAACMRAGRTASEPAAIIRSGTTNEQQVITSCLADLPAVAEAAGLDRSPGLLVIGPVVELREKLRWFEERPLFGKHVMVTRSRYQAGALSERLAMLGAAVHEMPLIRIEPVTKHIPGAVAAALAADVRIPADDLRHCDDLTRSLIEQQQEPFDWIVFTSVNGVQQVWRRLREIGRDMRIFSGSRIAAIGPATAEALACRGIVADLVPPKFTTRDLCSALLACEAGMPVGRTFLLLRADMADIDFARLLRDAGADVLETACYRILAETAYGRKEFELLKAGKVDAVTFASACTARCFAKIAGNELSAFSAQGRCPRFVSIGPATSAAMRESGIPVDAQAVEYTLNGLVDAVQKAIGR